MLTIALTGGIASGKSEVERRFVAHGIVVIDADRVSRDLVAPGMPALARITEHFGKDALAADGTLDRRRMRERIFADAEARRALEGILHPRVREAMRERAMHASGPYVMIAVPLLVESGRYAWIDRVLVVDVPRERQLERLTARDGVTPALAESMLAAQATRAQRLALADDVIDNAGALGDLDEKVAVLHQHYLALARDAG